MATVSERSLTDLASEILSDVQRLVRDEVRLARVEITESIRDATQGITWMAVAGVLAFLGVAFIGVAVFEALFSALPGWAAGLITAAVFLVLGGIAFFVGRSRLRASSLVPRETVRTLEEDREWIERRTR
jgi:uncharacterized membrane protein YqjE